MHFLNRLEFEIVNREGIKSTKKAKTSNVVSQSILKKKNLRAFKRGTSMWDSPILTILRIDDYLETQNYLNYKTYWYIEWSALYWKYFIFISLI